MMQEGMHEASRQHNTQCYNPGKNICRLFKKVHKSLRVPTKCFAFQIQTVILSSYSPPSPPQNNVVGIGLNFKGIRPGSNIVQGGEGEIA